MINGMFHREMKYHGKQIIIDACKCGKGYEVMVMYPCGKEIESTYTDDIDEAEKIYNGYRFKYENQEEAELKGRYAELRDALIKAVEAGKEADHGEDGGTCNFDSPSLALPRWNESKVKQAAKEAGTSCFKWELYGGARYVFTPPTRAQGNRRCRVSEAMCKALTDLQYDVLEYCAMD